MRLTTSISPGGYFRTAGRLLHLPLVLVFLLAFTGCDRRSAAVQDVESLQEALETEPADSELLSAAYREKAAVLINAYEDFVRRFPKDSLAPVYLFDAGSLSIMLQEHDRALGYFKRVVEEYPDQELAGESMYHCGYVYEKFKIDLGNARVWYERVLVEYPDLATQRNLDLQLQYLGDDDGLFNALRQRLESGEDTP